MSKFGSGYGLTDDLIKTVSAVMAGQQPEQKQEKEVAVAEVQETEEIQETVEVEGELVEVQESADLNNKNVDKALKHDCASHVVHEKHGDGECIPGMHTIEETAEGEGEVTHYDVMFKGEDGKPFIIESVPVSELKITKSESHMHTRKKK